MNNNISCDIIKDLLPGYIDGILSEAGTSAVKEHLQECENCGKTYLEMREELTAGEKEAEQIALDGFKKMRRRTKRLKIAVWTVTGLLFFLLLSFFVKIFVIGEPLSTHEIRAELSYDEETDCLEINGTVDPASCRVSRVVWEPDEENPNKVNILVYGAETLPFQSEKREFRISVPDMKGKTACFACPDYDRMEIFNWKHHHYELLSELENEIYEHYPELSREKDPLWYSGGTESVDGTEGICFSVDSIIGENATFWTFNDQLITDGEFESRDFEIWISLEKPRQILIYDYRTGKYTDDPSILGRHSEQTEEQIIRYNTVE